MSRYSYGPVISEAETTALPPDGLGPRPDANDVNAVAEYKVAEEGLRKRYLIEQGKYLKDVKSVNLLSTFPVQSNIFLLFLPRLLYIQQLH